MPTSILPPGCRDRMKNPPATQRGTSATQGPELLLNVLVEASDAAIVSCDPELRFTSWNRGAERILGYTAQEAIGQPVQLVTPPYLYRGLSRLKQRLRRGESIQDLETAGLRKDGSVIYVLVTAAAIIGTGGTMQGVSFVARDISMERTARSRLRETEEWLRLTLAHAPLMVTATDHEGVYTMVEGKALSAIGIEDNTLLALALDFMGKDSLTAETTRKAPAMADNDEHGRVQRSQF